MSSTSVRFLFEIRGGRFDGRRFQIWEMSTPKGKKSNHSMNIGTNSKVGEIITGKTKKIKNKLRTDTKKEKLKNSTEQQGKLTTLN